MVPILQTGLRLSGIPTVSWTLRARRWKPAQMTLNVDRPVWVVVSGLSRTGRAVRLRARGILGRILQHQIDHLDGVTFIDRVRTKPAA